MNCHAFARGRLLAVSAWLLAGTGMLCAVAGAGEPTHLRAPPDLLQKVGFTQKLGAQVPLDTVFRNTQGQRVRLGDVVGDRPTLLVPGYFSCVNLCGVVRSAVASAVAASGLAPGRQFNVILVSIDPDDGHRSAATTQQNDAAGHADAYVPRWHYLTGSGDASAVLMRAVGFRYLFDQRNGQYDHDAGIVLLTPQGRVSQYLFGVRFDPETLRLALVHASDGRIGNVVDHFLLLCCDYDPSTGRYSLVIHRVMQLLGLLTVVSLLLLIMWLRHREKRRDREGGSS